MDETPAGHVIDVVWKHHVDAPRLPVCWLSDDELAEELQRDGGRWLPRYGQDTGAQEITGDDAVTTR